MTKTTLNQFTLVQSGFLQSVNLSRLVSVSVFSNIDEKLDWTGLPSTNPRLSQMALDYLLILGQLSFFIINGVTHLYIPFAAMSVHVKRTFSQGQLLLLHVCSHLSVQSTCALLCVGVWSLLGYIKDHDVKAAAVLPAVDGNEEELAKDWDSIAVPE